MPQHYVRKKDAFLNLLIPSQTKSEKTLSMKSMKLSCLLEPEFSRLLWKSQLSVVTHMKRGFEEIVNRFDRMLAREARDRGEPQRGLVILAESSYRENLERLARTIWSKGHRWGELYNQADIPYFAPAQRSRLLQLADFVSNAVFGNYESGYARQFQAIAPRIDQQDGHLHGLVHMAWERQTCYCPACVARRSQPPIPSFSLAEQRD